MTDLWFDSYCKLDDGFAKPIQSCRLIWNSNCIKWWLLFFQPVTMGYLHRRMSTNCHCHLQLNHDDVIKWKHFRVTGPLCGEFTGHRWIPGTKASDAELWCFPWSAPWIGWVNNLEAGDLRPQHAQYDFIVMITGSPCKFHSCGILISLA